MRNLDIYTRHRLSLFIALILAALLFENTNTSVIGQFPRENVFDISVYETDNKAYAWDLIVLTSLIVEDLVEILPNWKSESSRGMAIEKFLGILTDGERELVLVHLGAPKIGTIDKNSQYGAKGEVHERSLSSEEHQHIVQWLDNFFTYRERIISLTNDILGGKISLAEAFITVDRVTHSGYVTRSDASMLGQTLYTAIEIRAEEFAGLSRLNLGLFTRIQEWKRQYEAVPSWGDPLPFEILPEWAPYFDIALVNKQYFAGLVERQQDLNREYTVIYQENPSLFPDLLPRIPEFPWSRLPVPQPWPDLLPSPIQPPMWLQDLDSSPSP